MCAEKAGVALFNSGFFSVFSLHLRHGERVVTTRRARLGKHPVFVKNVHTNADERKSAQKSGSVPPTVRDVA